MVDMTGFIDGVVSDFNQKRLDIITESKPDISIVVLTEDERDAFRARSGDTAAAYIETGRFTWPGAAGRSQG